MKNQIQLHIQNKKNAFEGWYYKFVGNNISLAVIVAIVIDNETSKGLIQIFDTKTNQKQIKFYPIEQVKYNDDPFSLKIDKNYFTIHSLIIDDENFNCKIQLQFDSLIELETTIYRPTIMGPFSYLKNMECNHGVISVQSQVHGYIQCSGQSRRKVKGIGYQEKDWGTSFPKRYLWLQSNHSKKQSQMMLSVATIDYGIVHFIGMLGFIYTKKQKYHIGTYYGAKVIKKTKDDHFLYITIKQRKYQFEFIIQKGNETILDGPIQGVMIKPIAECLDGMIKLNIYKNNDLYDSHSFLNCGCENIDFI